MTEIGLSAAAMPASDAARRLDLAFRLRQGTEFVFIPMLALGTSGILFALFLGALGKSPVEFFTLIWRGGFGTFFSWQSTLQRAAPLILTAFCVAIPARIGLTIIGGEGALVLGGFAAAISAIPMLSVAPPWAVISVMASAAILAGAAWIGLVGLLRHARGVNETISSLLMTYIAIAIVSFLV